MIAARTQDQVLTGLLAEGKTGWALPRDPAGRWAALLTPLAAVIADFEASAVAQLEQVDPRTADALLADYQRVLGADPCGDWSALAAVAQLQAYQRWTARGGQSAAYSIALAAAEGVVITVTEFAPAQAGILQVGGQVLDVTARFYWRVTLPAGTIQYARAGVMRAGDPLWVNGAAGLVCRIQRAAPAHTIVQFAQAA